MTDKKAVQKLIIADDGSIATVYIDLSTFQEIPENKVKNYKIINQNDNKYYEPVESLDNPNVPSKINKTPIPASEIDRHRGGDQGLDRAARTAHAPKSDATNNFGYIHNPMGAKVAAMLPGPIGMAAKLGETALNANNAGAAANAREYLGLPEEGIASTLRDVVRDNKGQVNDVDINGKPYSVGFEALSPEGMTNLTPQEARYRADLARTKPTLSSEATTAAREQQFKDEFGSQGILGGLRDKFKGVVDSLFDGLNPDRFSSTPDSAPASTSRPNNEVASASPTGHPSWEGAARRNFSPDNVARAGDNNNTTRGSGFVRPEGVVASNTAPVDYSGLVGKQRNQKPEAALMDKISSAVSGFFGPGYSVSVQAGKGVLHDKHGKVSKTGNANHPSGFAADFNVVGPDGRTVDQSRMEDFGAYAASKGLTGIGIGPGYMSPGEMHLDVVHSQPTAWGNNNTSTTMTPGVEKAIESAGFAGAPVFGLGLPEYQPNTPTARPTMMDTNPTAVADVGIGSSGAGSFNPMDFSGKAAMGVGVAGNVDTSQNFARNIVAQAKEPTGFARRQGLDPVISEDITQATPARMASMGINPRSPSEISHMALTLAGELSPTSLAGIAKKDPTAMRELADMVTSIENRASSQTYSGITGTLTPSQYNSLSRSHMPTTRANYEKFGPTLEAAINGYYTGNLTPDNYDITSYHNNYVRPDWSAGMTDVAATGHHKFGEVNDGLYAPSQDFQRERARMGIAQRNDPDTFTGHPDYTGADWGGYGYSSRKDTPSERGSRFGGSGLGYSGFGGLNSPGEGRRSSGSGIASRISGSDKEKDRSLGGFRSTDRDKDKSKGKDHSKGGHNVD